MTSIFSHWDIREAACFAAGRFDDMQACRSQERKLYCNWIWTDDRREILRKNKHNYSLFGYLISIEESSIQVKFEYPGISLLNLANFDSRNTEVIWIVTVTFLLPQKRLMLHVLTTCSNCSNWLTTYSNCSNWHSFSTFGDTQHRQMKLPVRSSCISQTKGTTLNGQVFVFGSWSGVFVSMWFEI